MAPSRGTKLQDPGFGFSGGVNPEGSQVQGGDDDYAPQERNPLHPPLKPEVKNTLEDAEGRLDSQGPEQYTSPWLPTLYLRG